MRFTIAREHFLAGLNAMLGAVATRATHPVLTNVQLTTEDGAVRLTGTDTELWGSRRVAAEVATEGALSVNAKRLHAVLTNFGAGPITATAEEGVILLQSGRSKIRLQTLPASEFPVEPKMDGAALLELPLAELRGMVDTVAYAVSTEETRPILNGLLVDVSADTLRVVATDGLRLAHAARPREGKAAPELIVHPRAFALAWKLFGLEDTVQISHSANFLALRTEGATLYTRLIEGPYPSWRQVVPAEYAAEVTVHRATFLAALGRVSVVAGEELSPVRLDFEPDGRLLLAAADPGRGRAEEEIAVEIAGDPFSTAYNARVLTSTLKAIPTDSVRAKVAAWSKRGTIAVFRAAGPLEEDTFHLAASLNEQVRDSIPAPERELAHV